MAEISHTAEDAGFDRIGVADHLWLHPIVGGPKRDDPECYATPAYLAAKTDRTGLLAMVTGIRSKAGELVERLRWLSGMGVQTVIGVVPAVDRISPLEIIGREVIPVVADLR